MDDPTFITTAVAINTSSNFNFNLKHNNYYFGTTGSSILELVISNSDFDALLVIAISKIDVARGLGHFGSELGNLLGLQEIAAFVGLVGSGQGT
jgi:hypothetical protein